MDTSLARPVNTLAELRKQLEKSDRRIQELEETASNIDAMTADLLQHPVQPIPQGAVLLHHLAEPPPGIPADSLYLRLGLVHRRLGLLVGTTAGRIDRFAPRLLDLGLSAMIGKGERSQEVVDAIARSGACYFAAVGYISTPGRKIPAKIETLFFKFSPRGGACARTCIHPRKWTPSPAAGPVTLPPWGAPGRSSPGASRRRR